MQTIFDYDGPLMTFLRKVMDLFVVNMLWLLCSIPIFTIGAATTAAYSTCFGIIRKEEGQAAKLFLKAFKDNFKQATLVWLISLGVVGLVAFEIYLLIRLGVLGTIVGLVLLVVFGISAVLVLFAMIYLFAVQAFFENSIKNTLKNALILGMSNYGDTLMMIVVDIILGLGTLMLAPIFFPILPIYINARVIYKIFKRYIGDDRVECLEEQTVSEE